MRRGPVPASSAGAAGDRVGELVGSYAVDRSTRGSYRSADLRRARTISF